MHALYQDNGKASGSKILLTMFVLAAIARYLFDGLELHLLCVEAGQTCGIQYRVSAGLAEAAAFLTPLAALNWGRRYTEAVQAPTVAQG